MIIAFSSAKGGVSKTSSCVNLAYALSTGKNKNRILLLDLDPQCGSTHHLSEKFKRKFNATLYEVFAKNCELKYAIHEYEEDLHFLPASPQLRKIDFADFEKKLEVIVAKVEKEYDYIFFDLAPSMYSGSTAPLYFSDYVIVPVNCPQGLSLLGLQAQAEIIVEVRKEKNRKLDVFGILPAFVDRTKMTKEVVEYLQKHYEEDMMPQVRKNTAISQASSIGKTIFEHAPKSSGAQDYASLAEFFMEKIKTVEKSYGSRKRKGRRNE